MNDYTLAEIFDTVYGQEFSEFDNPPKHFFSHRHRKAMKKMLYPHTVSALAVNRKISLKKRVIIALLVILLSALSITAGAAMIRGFTRQENRDHTELFAVNAANAPKTIDYVYYLPIIPDGYEPYEQVRNTRNVFTDYINNRTNRSLSFDQSVKEDFSTHLDNELSFLDEMEIAGKPTLYFYNKNNNYGILIWDNEDYILEVSGDFTKEELIALAESVEIKRE